MGLGAESLCDALLKFFIGEDRSLSSVLYREIAVRSYNNEVLCVSFIKS